MEPEPSFVHESEQNIQQRGTGDDPQGNHGGTQERPASRRYCQGNPIMSRKDSLLKMHDLLVKRRDALRQALAGDLSMLKSLREQIGGDVVDEALDAAQDEISSKLAEVESRELANIEVALERMRAGGYGQCEICDGKIPLARLTALPYATNCIDCQRAAESSGGGAAYSGDWSRVLDSTSGDVDVSFSDLEA